MSKFMKIGLTIKNSATARRLFLPPFDKFLIVRRNTISCSIFFINKYYHVPLLY